MTTPTPGDMSARLLACAKDCDVYSPDQCATLIDGIGWISMRELLTEAAAALSALPAAGGAVAWRWWDGTHWSYGERPSVRYRSTPLYLTTPQPSAAEGDGSPESAMQKVIDKVVDGVMGQREEVLRAFVAKYGFQPDEAVQVSGHDGSWRIIRRSDMYASLDAAVGAQGDGDDRALIDAAIKMLRADGFVRSADAIRHLAATAAGKGVDDAMVIRAENAYFDALPSSGGDAANPVAMRAALEAALTRQPVAGESHCVACGASSCRGISFCEPVAGDGWWEGVGNMRIGGIDRVVWRHTKIGVHVFADKSNHAAVDALLKGYTAPAATPTDGGEG